MRRWTVTPLLTVAAATAAVLAPRLFPIADPPVALPPPATTITQPPIEPVPVENQIRRIGIVETSIPEVLPTTQPTPVPPPVQTTPTPKPLPDTFWVDAVDCGMG